jgi:2-oxoglutarate/2-oxoacid ferredoxin oxidoreductase subunit beta
MSALTQKDYTSPYEPTWCPGCGNFSIFPATKMAFAALGLPPHQIAMVFDIGCSSNGSNFFNVYSFHSIHGRALPVAVGVKLANQKLTVLADAGDGGAFGEGISHFVHTARTNVDITYLVHDNHLYSLTTGQTSPTTGRGVKTKSAPHGSMDMPFNPVAAALINGATFVAQGYSGDIPHLVELIKQAIQHKGFAFVNILQICTTFNKVNDVAWYKEHTYKLDSKTYQPTDYQRALTMATPQDGKLPLGVLYQATRPTLEEEIPTLRQNAALTSADIAHVDITESMKEYA